VERIQILVVGGVGVDTIVRVKTLPPALKDSTLVPPVREYVGHTGNGVALGALALGLRTKFLDFIGDDPQGQMILRRYRERGLDFSYLFHESGTRRSVNLVDAAGHRMAFYDPRHPFDLRMPSEFYTPWLRATDHCHLSIMNWARHLYKEAQDSGVTTSTDLHDWDGENEYHKDFAYQSDLVFLSTAALGDRHEEVIRRIFEKGPAKVVVATAGALGGFFMAREKRTVQRFFQVDLGRPILDSNGAGDCFVAGYLSGHFEHLSTEECVLRGAIAGAYACSHEGTHQEFLSGEKLRTYASDQQIREMAFDRA
jgi:sugar/nucleoside kinase (ribokinase family)